MERSGGFTELPINPVLEKKKPIPLCFIPELKITTFVVGNGL